MTGIHGSNKRPLNKLKDCRWESWMKRCFKKVGAVCLTFPTFVSVICFKWLIREEDYSSLNATTGFFSFLNHPAERSPYFCRKTHRLLLLICGLRWHIPLTPHVLPWSAETPRIRARKAGWSWRDERKLMSLPEKSSSTNIDRRCYTMIW